MTSATVTSSSGAARRIEGHGLPFWSLAIIAAGMGALYGLCLYGSRANVTA